MNETAADDGARTIVDIISDTKSGVPAQSEKEEKSRRKRDRKAEKKGDTKLEKAEQPAHVKDEPKEKADAKS